MRRMGRVTDGGKAFYGKGITVHEHSDRIEKIEMVRVSRFPFWYYLASPRDGSN
jgi:hypothetical protein